MAFDVSQLGLSFVAQTCLALRAILHIAVWCFRILSVVELAILCFAASDRDVAKPMKPGKTTFGSL